MLWRLLGDANVCRTGTAHRLLVLLRGAPNRMRAGPELRTILKERVACAGDSVSNVREGQIALIERGLYWDQNSPYSIDSYYPPTVRGQFAFRAASIIAGALQPALTFRAAQA